MPTRRIPGPTTTRSCGARKPATRVAFETIFKRHHAPLLSYCRHMLGNQDEAEDALQQAFIKAHQALLHGTAPRELRPWLYAIARNCCLSAITARRATTPLEDNTPALEGLSEEVHQREDLRELVAGIGRLPEDQRSALLLAELDDLPHQAIATIVGCEVSKVKALIYQARSALIADRDALGASCQDIREQLAVAHGGELRRGPLRRHLKLCEGCRDFQLAVGAQRQSLAAVLPVLPSAGLAAAILGHGAAHAVGAASIGGASTGGAGVGASATGGAGIAASGDSGGHRRRRTRARPRRHGHRRDRRWWGNHKARRRWRGRCSGHSRCGDGAQPGGTRKSAQGHSLATRLRRPNGTEDLGH